MTSDTLYNLPAFNYLNQQVARFRRKDFHLQALLKKENRFQGLSRSVDLGGTPFFFDFSRQRMDEEIFNGLLNLSHETKAVEKFEQMAQGERINVTEHRPALHTLTREKFNPGNNVFLNSVKEELNTVDSQIKTLVSRVRSGTFIQGKTKSIKHAVVVGIGGSYLGCEFVYNALLQNHTPEIELHFLSNIDGGNFDRIIEKIQPENCLWIVISKSYTTVETLINQDRVLDFLQGHGLSAREYLITITAKGSPGDSSGEKLASFHMFDHIGGRYSVSSAVGRVPLSLAFGNECFEAFMDGCARMDDHTRNASSRENIPLIAALIDIWNTHFLKYSSLAIIPYSSSLARLPSHIQQLHMESLGKDVTQDGIGLEYPGGAIIFGEPGTNAQHSFFQLAHQGVGFPIEFIGILNPEDTSNLVSSQGVSNHQELWANLIAQAQTLAMGNESGISAKNLKGNRPSSILVLPDMSAESIGCLTAFYENRTVLEGFILGINPFDQFGVELGKIVASNLRDQMKAKNENPDHEFSQVEDSEGFYLNAVFSGSLS